MHPGVKRKQCPSLDNIDLGQQQQSLFELSIMKLQQEQIRHGVEPRLLRFVLINNGLRALQSHMQFEDDTMLECDYSTNLFLCNTFKKHGVLSSTPHLPPTPVKMLRLDTTFTDQSPRIASSPFQGASVESEGKGEGEGGEGKRPMNSLAVVNQSCSGVHLGKHSADVDGRSGEEKEEKMTKKPCQTHLNGTKLNGTTAVYSVLDHIPLANSPLTDTEDSSSSTIDFANVDPTLYDFDTRTNLALPCSQEGKTPPSNCAMQAIANPVVRNGDCDQHCSSTKRSTAPEGGGENDYLDDLDHIVKLLMT